MAVINAVAWPLRLLAVGLVTAGLGAGVYFLAQAGDGDEQQLVVAGTATAEGAASPTVAPSPTATGPPRATEPPPTVAESTPIPRIPTRANDTRVPIRDVPSPNEIQLGTDGQYFIADRGDGCTWHEYLRRTEPDIGTEVFLRTDCPADFAFTFRLDSGEVLLLLP